MEIRSQELCHEVSISKQKIGIVSRGRATIDPIQGKVGGRGIKHTCLLAGR